MSREVVVSPERLAVWFAGFTRRNGDVVAIREADDETIVTTDRGGRAQIRGRRLAAADVDALCAQLLPPASAAVLLIRRGGYAIARAACAGAGHHVLASKTGRRYVQGRTAAGGQSQQRYARRRGNQADALVGEAADAARRVLGDRPDSVDLLVTGGDSRLVDDLLRRPPLTALTWVQRRHVDVGEPRRADVDHALRLARSVRIQVSNADCEEQQ